MNKFAKEEEIIKKYINVKDDIFEIMKNSKLKLQYFADLLGLKRTQFYYKRKNKSFTAEELQIILKELDKLS